MAKIENYYVGLDCGSASVGWAVTNEDYHIPRIKGQRAWGVRLFDMADTAAERRTYRSARRRNARAKKRIKLLNLLFRDEISQIDPDFYTRLRESFYLESDKINLLHKSKNTLFNDEHYTDKDFYQKYPTIWHLRHDIIHHPDQKFDIRHYYLAIHHILKNRGHFLYSGKMTGSGDFAEIYNDFVEIANNHDYSLDDSDSTVNEVMEIIIDKQSNKHQKLSKTDKKKQLSEIMFIEQGDESKTTKTRQQNLAGLLIGSKVSYTSIFNLESDDKNSYSFADSNFEDKIDTDILQLIGEENLDLILAAKKIYDYMILNHLLGEHIYISDAMVANYVQHQKDLKALKAAIKPYPEDYQKIFKACVFDKHAPSYNAYIGKAFTEDKNGRRKTARVDQETFNKYLAKVLSSHNITGDLLDRAENGELLPKQKGQAKGTIPMQLHHNELEIILEHLAKDYPSFAQPTDSEPAEHNTKCKKIAMIHSFRIPYYCGPLVKREYDDEGNLVENGKSAFSWGDEEIKQLVYPWNFQELVDLDRRATNFIRRMTNECTYIIGADVLPKASLLYQKYLVLNELNNLKINGKRISDVKLKQEIYQAAFVDGQLLGNPRLKGLQSWLVDNGFISKTDELSGTNSAKLLPKLKTHLDMIKCLGEDYLKNYTNAKLEEVIEAITVLGEEKAMLCRRVQAILGCDEKTALKLSKLSYQGWGKFSAKFLSGITAPVDGTPMTIIDALYYTNHNLMELLGGEFEYTNAIKTYNDSINQHDDHKVSYHDVADLYCSPAVKRTVWQAIKIVRELTHAIGHPPKKIFLEVNRENEDETAKNKNAAMRLRRREQLLSCYAGIKDCPADLVASLETYEDRDLQSKKLYLYYTQMGHCAYCGSRIDLESLHSSAYDIDHIYPRSLTKDDSITRNLVLVDAACNRKKSNVYPILPEWRSRMLRTWQAWRIAGLITKEKYDRLSRGELLTPDELGDFIARQLVETSQSIKAIGELLKRAYPQSKIVTVKAGQVSQLRHTLSNDRKDSSTGHVIQKGQYEFIKLRDLNDLHHAKDAYLNIVVGNVMNSTFTSNPYQWVKQRQGQSYSIDPRLLFRSQQEYTKKDGKKTVFPEVKGWNFQESLDIISRTMQRNDILWTRMPQIESGQISDLLIVGKAPNSTGLLPIKNTRRLANVDQYGGYNSIKGSYVALIELENKKQEKERRLIQIPIIHKADPESYVKTNYHHGRIIIPVIPFKSYLKLNGFPMHIAGRTGNNIIYYPAIQVIFPTEDSKYLKQIIKVNQKLKLSRGKYKIDAEKDGITLEQNVHLLDLFLDKLNAFQKMSPLGSKIAEIKEHREDFIKLDIAEQCEALGNFLKIFSCNATSGDLSSFVPKASHLGKGVTSDNLNKYETAELICQSPTGLYQTKINLKEVE